MPVPKEWFLKFSSTKPVKIIPYNPKILDLVKEFTKILRKTVGKDVEIQHRGATALGISGEGEVDLYIMVSPKKWLKLLKPLENKFGKPGSIDHEWARFNHTYKGTEFEIMLVHKNCQDNVENRIFFNYLESHTKARKDYEKLKAKYAKVSKREYRLQKDKFVKKIMKLNSVEA
jgi:GrpB-like predicted nucleotidyltransferase (UPF0157 family)